MTEKQSQKIIEMLLAELERKETDIYFLKRNIENLKKGDVKNG